MLTLHVPYRAYRALPKCGRINDEDLVRDLARGGYPPPKNIQSLST
jgi:hypothetical protein